MRRAKYDMKQVVCKNSMYLGYSSNIAKPGYWVAWDDGSGQCLGRVMGRVADTDYMPGEVKRCIGWLAIMTLSCEAMHAHVLWVDPGTVTACYEKPPAQLLAWITGEEWVKSAKDIARLVAMSDFGTCSESFISGRNEPDKAYNARPAYVNQFILK